MFVSANTLINARNNICQTTKKPETFTGLMLFLYCSSIHQYGVRKANMQSFSELADLAFHLDAPSSNPYPNKEWHGLFTIDWVEETKNRLLKGKSISASNFFISLFWYRPYNDINDIISDFKNKIGADVFSELFYIDSDIKSLFTETTACSRSELYETLNTARNGNFTIRFNNEFIAKRAGDLSGAPFAQTLYAANDIKHIITIYDFDIFQKIPLFSKTSHAVPAITTSKDSYHLPKPFILLAGISGTGKSRFVREQGNSSPTSKCKIIPVRPDWHEPSDLLGYVSRLNNPSEYIMTDTLRFIIEAWQEIEKAGLIVNNQVSGDKSQLDNVPPYWLCLDEMNLAPVEQYFADYLSIIETRKWDWSSNFSNFTYFTEPLLSKTTWEGLPNFKATLGVSDTLWDFFEKNQGIGIPFNLIVVGTVNMDETTHAFSRKVLDRALSLDFSKFYPNNFNEFFNPQTKPKALTYPIFSNTIQTPDSQKSIDFLSDINKVLDGTAFELGFRALNELLLAVNSFKPSNDDEFQAVWDDFIMTKVLPRIEGDENKVGNTLSTLEEVLKIKLDKIWDTQRLDLWRENIDTSTLTIQCRSKYKLEKMIQQLNSRGIVSFW